MQEIVEILQQIAFHVLVLTMQFKIYSQNLWRYRNNTTRCYKQAEAGKRHRWYGVFEIIVKISSTFSCPNLPLFSSKFFQTQTYFSCDAEILEFIIFDLKD